jgi:GDSL-like lipase/acylhydrolase family protein
MKALASALFVLLLLTGGAEAQRPDKCDVPGYLLFGEHELGHVNMAVKDHQRLDILIIGSGSSTLAGPEGKAYPRQMEAALKARLPNVTVNVAVHAAPRHTAGDMVDELKKIVREQRPDLVIWQTGTVDAMRAIEPDEFGSVLNRAVEKLRAGGTDVILMNMQYSPRTETMIAVGPYAENMRWVSQQRNVPLFDRLGIMRHWSDTGVFDFYTPTKAFVVAQKVHECIGRALASLVIDAAQLGPMTAKVAQ